MKVSVFIEKVNKKQQLDLPKGSKVIDVLRKLKIDHTTVIVARDKDIITEDQVVKEKDSLKIISVISGG